MHILILSVILLGLIVVEMTCCSTSLDEGDVACNCVSAQILQAECHSYSTMRCGMEGKCCLFRLVSLSAQMWVIDPKYSWDTALWIKLGFLTENQEGPKSLESNWPQ